MTKSTDIIARLRKRATDWVSQDAAAAIEDLEGFLAEAERDRDEYRERLDKTNDLLLNRWIPVAERLPEEYYPVLMLTEICNYVIGEYDGEHKSFVDMSGYRYVVTHWMPLPAPPQNEHHD